MKPAMSAVYSMVSRLLQARSEQADRNRRGAGARDPGVVAAGRGGHDPAVGPAQDAERAGVDPAELLAGGVGAGHHVGEVSPAPARAGIGRPLRPADGPAPLLAVAGAAPRVAVQDAEAGRGLELEVIGEAVPVLGERAAVHVEQ